MNNIFFMMWLSDIAYTIVFPLGIVAFGGLVCGICVKLFVRFDSDGESAEDIKTFSRFANTAIVAGAISAAVLTVIPTRHTMQMYIAAQAGQEIRKTPTGSKALSALDAVLDKITKEAGK